MKVRSTRTIRPPLLWAVIGNGTAHTVPLLSTPRAVAVRATLALTRLLREARRWWPT